MFSIITATSLLIGVVDDENVDKVRNDIYKIGTGVIGNYAYLYHYFEKLGWKETDIVKLFWAVGIILSALAIVFGVWI